jgi:transposase
MADLSIDLRRRIVEAYRNKKSGTYVETAEMFRVGEATVSRLLRRQRETGDVLDKRRGGNNPRRIDLEWLQRHLEENRDARVVDRIEAWVQLGGRRVGETAMLNAIRALGWTHKKSRWLPVNEIDPT